MELCNKNRNETNYFAIIWIEHTLAQWAFSSDFSHIKFIEWNSIYRARNIYPISGTYSSIKFIPTKLVGWVVGLVAFSCVPWHTHTHYVGIFMFYSLLWSGDISVVVREKLVSERIFTKHAFRGLSRCFCHNYWRKSLKFIQFMWFIRWIKLFLLEVFQEKLPQNYAWWFSLLFPFDISFGGFQKHCVFPYILEDAFSLHNDWIM